MIYLDYRIVLAAEEMGHRPGRPRSAPPARRWTPWTLNTDHADAQRSVQRLVALKVDQITTDEPERTAGAVRKSLRRGPVP